MYMYMYLYIYAIDCLMSYLYDTVYIFVYIYYIILCSLKICNTHYSSSDLSILVLQDLLLIWAVLMSSQRVKQLLSTDWLYIYIYIYGIHHRRILWSSYRKLAWVGFEPTTTEFRSDALTDWAIRPRVQLALSSTRTIYKHAHTHTTLVFWRFQEIQKENTHMLSVKWV